MTVPLCPSRWLMKVLLLAGMLLVAACDSNDPEEAFDDLPTSAPEAQDVDAQQLQAAFAQAEQVAGIQSLVVVRNGHLIGESYYNNFGRDDVHHVRSVTKSVLSILTGLAIDQGHLTGVEQEIGPLLEDVTVLEPEKSAIQVEHLLTMTSGFAWSESGTSTASGYVAWINAPDQINYLTTRPLSDAPGTRFNYNSAAVHLLAVVLAEATGTDMQTYATEQLWGPLGIPRTAWETDARGYYNGGAGLQLRPRDMAKLGVVVLQNGQWNGQQVIPASWVQTMTQSQVGFSFDSGPLQDVDYGYLWWLDRGSRPLAWGYGGQFIYIDAARDLVVVTTARWQLDGTTANQQEQALQNLVINQVLPAVQ